MHLRKSVYYYQMDQTHRQYEVLKRDKFFCQNPTQLNSTQLNSKATSVGVRHSSHVYPTPPTPPPPQTFQPLLDQLES